VQEGYRQKLGAYGEQLAEDFFRRRGYITLDKNFRTREGEIDLIVRNGNELLFVEVKTRMSDAFGYPENAVDFRKLAHLHQAINIYFSQNIWKSYWRLDIISIEINRQTKKAKIVWFKDI
jgi:putative endonuclease